MSAAQEVETSPIKVTPTSNTRPNRLPAPTLFVGPPSRNASQLSLSHQISASAVKAAREPLQRQKSNYESSLRPKDIPTIQLRRPSEKSIETKWREMQSTLNEVELTAQSSQQVFGDRHAAALDELRRAQINLAKAWGRGNDEQATGKTEAKEAVPDIPKITRKRGDTEASNSTQLSGESETSESTMRSMRSHLEDDTAEDIRLANERRAANEAYFKKVDQSVKEVVSKLEAVAEAMRGVEGESRSLWDGSSASTFALSEDLTTQPHTTELTQAKIPLTTMAQQFLPLTQAPLVRSAELFQTISADMQHASIFMSQLDAEVSVMGQSVAGHRINIAMIVEDLRKIKAHLGQLSKDDAVLQHLQNTDNAAPVLTPATKLAKTDNLRQQRRRQAAWFGVETCL